MSIISRLGWAFKDNIPARSLQIANIIRFISSVLVGVILIKFLMVDKAVVGRLEFYLFLSAILSNFWIFGFKNGLLSYYEDLDREDKSKLFSSVFILLTVVGMVVGLFTWIISQYVFIDRLIEYQLSGHILWIAAYVAIIIPASLGDYYLLLTRRYKGVVFFGAVFGILYLVGLVLPFAMGKGVGMAIKAMVTLAAIKGVVSFVLAFSGYGFGYKKSLIVTFAVFSIPLVLQVFLGFMQEFVDGWIVSTFYSPEMFANFRYGARELPFSMILISGLVASMIPAYKKDKEASLHVIKRESRRLTKLLFTTGTILIFVSPFLFRWAYDATFDISAQIFNVYLLLLLSRVFLPHIFLFGYNKNWLLPTIVVIELVINVGLSLALLPYFGILGVAFATVVANLIEKIIMIIYVHFKWDIKLHQYLDIRTYLGYSTLLVGAFVLSHLIDM